MTTHSLAIKWLAGEAGGWINVLPAFVFKSLGTTATSSLLVLCAFGATWFPSESGASWLFGPDTAKECRSEYIGEAETDFAVRLIAKACNDLFGGAGREEWAKCILDHATDTGSDAAVKLIAQSCSRMAVNRASKRDKCLLSNLPGTKIDSAARQIAHSCSD